MTKEFVKYEKALALKELGFDEKCIAADYDANGKISIQYADEGITNTELDEITAECNEDAVENGEKLINYDPAVPLYQQAFRWFREKHGLLHDITLTLNINDELESFYIIIHKLNGLVMNEDDDIELNVKTTNKEEAESACLDKLIEICKTKTNE